MSTAGVFAISHSVKVVYKIVQTDCRSPKHFFYHKTARLEQSPGIKCKSYESVYQYGLVLLQISLSRFFRQIALASEAAT